MKLAKSYLEQIFKGNKLVMDRLSKIKSDMVYFDFMEPDVYKTNLQNRLFHGLLSVFWDSGCSSYLNYDDMRLSYKRIAGLLKRRDGVLIEGSWSDATKEQASRAIDNLIREMDMCGVSGSSQGEKYCKILKTIGQLN